MTDVTVAATSLAVDTSLAMASFALDAPWITSSSAVDTALATASSADATSPTASSAVEAIVVMASSGKASAAVPARRRPTRPGMARARSRPCEESVAVFCSKLSHGHGSFLAHDTRNGDKRIILVQDYFPAFHATFLRSCTG